jgi:hypothetical protein
MSLNTKDANKNLVKEITFILIIKVIILIMIKNIWFDAPTIPKNFNSQAAERIAGGVSSIKETR